MKTAQMEVKLIGSYGDDLLVVNAARVSMAKHHDEFDPESDTRLIKYLARENHWVPFAHPHTTFHIKAPVFVARQLVKHQVGLSWSEVSRRYIDSEPEFWLPKIWRGRPEGSIKQGSAGVVSCFEVDNDVHIPAFVTENVCADALEAYNLLLEGGVAPEQARMVLPLNTMTEWIWSGSLAAWARVCKLRLDPHAQAETREIAEHIDIHMGTLFPVSWKELTA